MDEADFHTFSLLSLIMADIVANIVVFYFNIFLPFFFCISFPTHCCVFLKCISSFFLLYFFSHTLLCAFANVRTIKQKILTGSRASDSPTEIPADIRLYPFYLFILLSFYLLFVLSFYWASDSLNRNRALPNQTSINKSENWTKGGEKNKLMRRWQHQKALVSEGTRYNESCQKRKSIKTETFGPTS